VRDRIEDQEQK